MERDSEQGRRERAIELRRAGWKFQAICQAVGRSHTWLAKWLRRVHAHGLAGLADRSRRVPTGSGGSSPAASWRASWRPAPPWWRAGSGGMPTPGSAPRRSAGSFPVAIAEALVAPLLPLPRGRL